MAKTHIEPSGAWADARKLGQRLDFFVPLQTHAATVTKCALALKSLSDCKNLRANHVAQPECWKNASTKHIHCTLRHL